MEAIIKTNNRNLFESLLQFLRTLNISVETKEEKNLQNTSNQITKKNNKFTALQLKTKNFKFNREEANVR